MAHPNPCLHCGACCAFFRVSFYWGETDPTLGGTVPAELTEYIDDFHVCMKGTNQPRPRCAALQGQIGKQVGCAIYDKRSSTCEAFGLHCDAHGVHATLEELARCNRARAAWGLHPLPRTLLIPHRQSGVAPHTKHPKRFIHGTHQQHHRYISRA